MRNLLLISLFAALASSILTSPLQSQGSTSSPANPQQIFTDDQIPKDNIEGNYVLQEVEHLSPMVHRGNILATVNRPSGQLVFFTVSPLQRIHATPLGLGPNSVYEHPGRPWEFWITDSVSNCVTVWSPFTLSITHTVQTSGAPHGLVFDGSGNRAYVSCSSGRTIDVIDTVSYTRIESHAIEARDPRGLARIGSRLYLTPLMSGNNTTAVGSQSTTEIAYLPDFQSVGINPLPDDDLLVFQPAVGAMPPLSSEWVKACGTTLFNLQRRPGTSELWIPNTEALNTLRGEPSFDQGKVVSNRITIVDTATPGTPTILDLDALASTSGISASQPRAVAFNGSQVFVACEGGDTVLALSASGAWLGYWKISSVNQVRAMPQGLRVVGDDLIVFNYGTNSLCKIDLTSSAYGTTISSHVSLGFDPAPLSVRRGRGILNDADRSADGSSSCASCHIAGHTNHTVYNLGDHLHDASTPPNQVVAWTDNKGPMVTQSLRGLPENAPYHWRGERPDLEAFNIAFEGLLKGNQLTAQELDDMVAYVSALHYPANPEQELDRSTTPNQLEGARIFIEELASPNNSCNDCHTLPTGTNGEVMRELNGIQATSFVVTQLRAIKDKDLGDHDLGIVNGIPAGSCTLIGPGLLHNGRIPSLFDFSEGFVNIDTAEADRLVDFMTVLDTGLARSTAYQATVTQANAGSFDDHLTLIAAAQAGHSGLVVTGSVDLGAGGIVQGSFVFNPGNGLFVPAHPSWPVLPPSTFITLAQIGYGAWTFIGTPRGMSFRKGIDLDGDLLTDLREADFGTDPENPDTDGDGFPDGYEVLNGMNPNSSLPETPTDTQAPTILSVEVLWKNTNTIKYRVRTDEPSRVVASWNGIRGPEQRVSPTYGPFDISHSFVVNFLPAGTATPVSFTATDPAGLSSPASVDATVTDALQFPDRLFVQSVGISIGPIGITPGPPPLATTTVTMTAQLASTLGSGAVGNASVSGFLYFDGGSGAIQVIDPAIQATTNAAGLATFTATVSWTPVGGTRELYFGVWDAEADPAFTVGYVEAFDLMNTTSLIF